MKTSSADLNTNRYQNVSRAVIHRGIKGLTSADGIYVGGTGIDQNANTLPNSFKEKIRAQAKKDATGNDHMSKEYLALERGYMQQHISPNRSGAISQVSSFMQRITAANRSGMSILDLFGMPYQAKVDIGRTKTTAAVYNERGEMIAGYHSDSGWGSVLTQAEDQYWTETTKVYNEAWDEAIQQMQTAPSDTTVSFRAQA